MENVKENAVADYLKRRSEKAKDEFQQRVDEILCDITSLSKQLKNRKQALLNLKYEEPEELDIT